VRRSALPASVDRRVSRERAAPIPRLRGHPLDESEWIPAATVACSIRLPQPATKLMLMLLAIQGCETCGRVCLSMDTMCRQSGLSSLAVAKALQRLVVLGLITPRPRHDELAEWIVLPSIARGERDLAPAPCDNCSSRNGTS